MGNFKKIVYDSESTERERPGLVKGSNQVVSALAFCAASHGKKKSAIGVLLGDGLEQLCKVQPQCTPQRVVIGDVHVLCALAGSERDELRAAWAAWIGLC